MENAISRTPETIHVFWPKKRTPSSKRLLRASHESSTSVASTKWANSKQELLLGFNCTRFPDPCLIWYTSILRRAALVKDYQVNKEIAISAEDLSAVAIRLAEIEAALSLLNLAIQITITSVKQCYIVGVCRKRMPPWDIIEEIRYGSAINVW